VHHNVVQARIIILTYSLDHCNCVYLFKELCVQCAHGTHTKRTLMHSNAGGAFEGIEPANVLVDEADEAKVRTRAHFCAYVGMRVRTSMLKDPSLCSNRFSAHLRAGICVSW